MQLVRLTEFQESGLVRRRGKERQTVLFFDISDKDSIEPLQRRGGGQGPPVRFKDQTYTLSLQMLLPRGLRTPVALRRWMTIIVDQS